MISTKITLQMIISNCLMYNASRPAMNTQVHSMGESGDQTEDGTFATIFVDIAIFAFIFKANIFGIFYSDALALSLWLQFYCRIDPFRFRFWGLVCSANLQQFERVVKRVDGIFLENSSELATRVHRAGGFAGGNSKKIAKMLPT